MSEADSKNVPGLNELAAALAKAQGQLKAAIKDATNPHFKSSYADLASVWEACRKPLSDNGLSVVQVPVEAPAGYVGLRTVLLHSSGQSISEVFYMPVSQPNNPQSVGSALTYARRYALSAYVGIAPEDDDGNSASPGPRNVPEGAQSLEQVRKKLNGGK